MTEYRRAYRPAERRLMGGVSAGLAEHLGIPVMYVRLAFIVATFFNGAGVVSYLLLWRFLPLKEPVLSPGLETATRSGYRPQTRPSGFRTTVEILQTAAVCAIGLGLLMLLQISGRGISWRLLVPLLIALIGLALIWRQFDDANWSRWVRQTSGWGSASRIGVGVVMVGFAGLYFLSQERGWGALVDLISAGGVAVIGISLILGPWIYKLTSDLSAERRERIRSQERADVAAHLHDSVLQTLALLQKNAADPGIVSTLARRQERELRAWLYGDENENGDSLVAVLKATAADVEADHLTPVEVIAVGDAALNPDVSALAKAAREAMINAAKHARVDRIDVYVEVADRRADVFVRDRGVGFDTETIADDRMGVRGSIVGRLERHGGTATIKSAPGEGTEVKMSLPLRDSSEHQHESQESSV
ncbi:MAG: PspC domain-containing protein [Aeromicrobium sp.]